MNQSLLDHPLLSARYFYPWPTNFDDPFMVAGDGYSLGCRFRMVDPELPTIVHFHGNGETVEDYIGAFEDRIAGLGANLFLAEYRGYGMSTGEPALAALLADIPLVVAATGVAPERIIFFGRSLGSLYAAHAASLYPQAAGLIIESGIADPLDRILVRVEPWQLGTTEEDLRCEVDGHFNQQAKIASFRGQVLIMHTRNDDLVHVSHAERLYSWANEPKELLIFDRGDHNTILPANEAAYFAAVGRLLQSVSDTQARVIPPG